MMEDASLEKAVSAVLADPAFAKLLGEVRGESAEASGEGSGVPSLPPEIMAKLPQMMEALAPLVGGGEKTEENRPPEKKDPHGAVDAGSRKRLLSALRPYLSGRRRDAVENILRVTEMTDLLGGSDAGRNENR